MTLAVDKYTNIIGNYFETLDLGLNVNKLK